MEWMTALIYTAVMVSGFVAIMPEMGVETGGAGRGAGPALLEEMPDRGLPGKWLMDFEAARQLAAQQHVPLIVHFEATWCGPCRQMNASVLNQPDVLSLLRMNVVGVRIDADESPQLVSRFSVASLPTEIVLSPDGQEIARHVGMATLEAWVARTGALPESSTSASASQTAATGAQPSGNASTGDNSEHGGIAASGGASSADENSANSDKLRSCLIVQRDGKTVGLGGYSPVALIGQRVWEKGSEEWVAEFEGVEYFFRDSGEREQFQRSPESYVPRLHGCDPVRLHRDNRAEAGAIEYGAFYKGHLFFFASLENRRRFQVNPEWYAEVVAAGDAFRTDQFPFLKTEMIE